MHAAALWLGHQVARGMAWFDKLPSWLAWSSAILALLACMLTGIVVRRWRERFDPRLEPREWQRGEDE